MMALSTLLILVHFLSYGFQGLVAYKAAQAGYDRLVFTYLVAAVTCVFLLPVLWLYLIELPAASVVSNGLTPARTLAYLTIIIFMGGGYVAISYARLQGQALLPTYIFLPLSKSGLLLVVVLSVVYLNEQRTWVELVAAFSVFLLLVFSNIVRSNDMRLEALILPGVAWSILSAVCSAGLQIGTKVFIDPQFGIGIPVLLFVFGVNLSNAVIAFLIRMKNPRPCKKGKELLVWGSVAGMLNVLSFGTLAIFLVEGDASRIYPISAMSILIPSLVLRLMNKERIPSGWEALWYLLALAALAVLV